MWQGMICVLVVAMASCAKTDTSIEQRHATVQMLDGTKVAGQVTATTPTEVTIQGDDGVSKTIPMKQVKSIEYYDAPPAATASGVLSSPSAVAHESHYHPPQAAIRTKTYALAAGSEVPVRVEETIDSGKGAEGQSYAAEVSKDILDADGAVVIPEGSNAKVVIKSATKGGRFVYLVAAAST